MQPLTRCYLRRDFMRCLICFHKTTWNTCHLYVVDEKTEANLPKASQLTNGTMLGFNQPDSKTRDSSTKPHCAFHSNYAVRVALGLPQLLVSIQASGPRGLYSIHCCIFTALTAGWYLTLLRKYPPGRRWVRDFHYRMDCRGSKPSLDSALFSSYSYFSFRSTPQASGKSSLHLPLPFP